MIKTQKFLSTFSGGIDTDTSVNKYDNTFYFDAENMRIISNDNSSSGALETVKGNVKRLVFDSGDEIIGYCKIRSNVDADKDAIVFFAYNPATPTSRIYLFEGDPFKVEEEVIMTAPLASYTYNTYAYKAGWIFADDDLNFSVSNPIKAEGRYESANIRKVYWVDGINTIRYMILDRVDSGDPVTVFDINPTATLTEPSAEITTGGAYRAGMVQYSYQLYIKNGAATTYAPASELLYLTGNDSGLTSATFAGSNLGDNTGKAVKISLSNLDTDYNRVRIVAIYYTESLINPVVNIIGEFEYNSNYLTAIDNGYTVYGTIPIEEFRLFGQTNYIANSLAAKNNYLFFGDITEDKWTPDWLTVGDGSYWDARAVRFKTNAVVTDTDNGTVVITSPVTPGSPASWNSAGWSDYVYNHDGINEFNDTDNDSNPLYDYIYQSDGATLGAEGPNVVIDFETENLTINADSSALSNFIYYSDYPTSPVLTTHRSSQRREVYRMYIVFYNTKMQSSIPQWICDLRMPSNDDYLICELDVNTRREAQYLYPRVTVRNLPVDADLYGWQIFRCERGSTDRSVLASGALSPCQLEDVLFGQYIARPYSSNTTWPYGIVTAEDIPVDVSLSIIEMISPEIAFNKNLTHVAGDKLRIEGRYLVFDDADKFQTANDDNHVTISLGPSYATHAADVLNYPVIEGKLQAPGITYGNPPVHPSSQLIGSTEYKHFLRYDDGAAHYIGNRGTSFIALTNADLSISPINWGIIFGSYVRNVFDIQYGGNTYEARSYNSVIPYSALQTKYTASSTCYRGDTHITMFSYMRSSIPDVVVGGGNDIRYQQEVLYIPCESSINCFYRTDQFQKYYSAHNTFYEYKLQETLEQGLILQPTDYPIELGDLYRYNAVYSKSNTANLLQNIIFDANTIEHSDVKIIATGKKINNEYFDTWTNLYTNNNIELDPKFGPIRNIFNFNNRLFAGQDKGISVISVNDRSVIQDNSNLQLVLGTGGVLERYDYLTTTSGFQNYFDLLTSDKSIYYLDRRNKIIYNLTGEGDVPVSEIKGYRSFLKTYGAITTVKTGYDPIYKEGLFYITDGTISKNSVYSEYTTSFTGKHTFSPDLMFNLNDQFYSAKDNEVYIHNYGDYGNFYGTVSDSTLTDIINPNGNIINTFDTVETRVDVIDTDGIIYLETEQFNHLDANNNYQSISKALTFSGDDSVEDTSKSITRKWRTRLLPDDNSTDDFFRMVDSYYKLKLTRHNTDNKRLVLHDIISYYRPTKS